jgi:hypothetical protein
VVAYRRYDYFEACLSMARYAAARDDVRSLVPIYRLCQRSTDFLPSSIMVLFVLTTRGPRCPFPIETVG